MTHEQRLEAARLFRVNVLNERERLRGELLDVTAARDRLQAFIDTPDWGEMDSGDAIKAGDIVRFGLARYRARVDHNKALTRSPLNLIYWELEVSDG